MPPITMLGRNLSIPTGDGNASFRATNDASVVMRYAVSAAYPVYKTQWFHLQRGFYNRLKNGLLS